MKLYHTETQEDYDALMIELEGKGVLWSDGDKPTVGNCWQYEEEKTVIGLDEDKITYMTLVYAEKYYPNIPIQKYKALSSDKRYTLYLNDGVYGVGSLQYVRELINEWIDRDLYGSNRAMFEIVERRDLGD